MGLSDSDGQCELRLIRLAKLTRLKENPHISSKERPRTWGVFEVQLMFHLLLSLKSYTSQGKALGLHLPWLLSDCAGQGRTLSLFPCLVKRGSGHPLRCLWEW
jgi:hypothetical protein